MENTEYQGTVRELVNWPADVLSTACEPVSEEEFGTDELKHLVLDLLATMRHYKGVGIAAPQIGVNKRVCVVSGPEYRAFEMVNPVVIVESGDAMHEMEEGCLSAPGFFITRERPMVIRVAFRAAGGEEHADLTATKVFATIIQHEVDHLDGKMMMDDYIGDSKLKADRVKDKVKKGIKARSRKS